MSPPAARPRSRPNLRSALVGVVALVALVGALGQPAASSLMGAAGEVVRGGLRGAAARTDGAVSAADGALPDGVTVFDDQYAGVADLDPELLRALRAAATGAADRSSGPPEPAGRRLDLYVTSGWRSPAYQSRLLREATARYGSAEEAARWVATPATSPHVSGDAVDLRISAGTAWLSEHGARYGLCQIYRNEPWHYELRPDTRDHGCPPMYADPTQDPRMHR